MNMRNMQISWVKFVFFLVWPRTFLVYYGKYYVFIYILQIKKNSKEAAKQNFNEQFEI